MKGREIIGNAIDLAGAAQVEKLEAHTATLHYLNAISDRNLQLELSSRGHRFYQIADDSFAAGASSGTLTDQTLRMRPQYVRYLTPIDSTVAFSRYGAINVVDTIEELTEASNRGEKAVIFTGVAPINYLLSWTPQEALAVQIYGTAGADTQTDIADEPDFPQKFADLISVQIALFMLDELLLLENAEKFVMFVNARKPGLETRLKRLERLWDVYRSNATEGKTVSRPYDPMEEDYSTVFEERGGEPWL